MKRYLLSTGQITEKVEEYVIDLFNLYLVIYSKDIPHRNDLGSNFNLSGYFKDELPTKLEILVNDLISKIQDKVGSKVNIKKISLDLIDEEKAKLVISVNQLISEDIFIKVN